MSSKTDEIRDHYSDVASSISTGACCCAPGETGGWGDYAEDVLQGLPESVRAASRGCGDPVAQAGLKPGEVVCDLGSGGGIDALIASRLVGDEGHVYGVDMTPEMVELASDSAEEAGFSNVEFMQGDIEDIPLADGSVDVVISNCVINLAEHKEKVLEEAARILKPGGRLVVSDIVCFDAVPEGAMPALSAITGCRRGVSSSESYARMLEKVGFNSCEIEPKTIYTFDVLEEKSSRKGLSAQMDELRRFPAADGASGSAIVMATK